ncbi:MAG: Fic family protein [Oscillospiraceae bacterium]|nr:Fic family protein [Oscillospiraceae bacterium]
MEYTELSKLFYSDQAAYEQAYHERFNSPYAQHIDMKIGDWPAFFVVTPEIHTLMLAIQKADKNIRALCRELPGVAIKQFSRRCLIDEIMLTNGIEGVHSTRREIDGVLVELERNDKHKRFAGLVQKYAMLQEKADLPLSTCEDIRKIYDDLVLNEVAEDAPDNIPDGTVFRKEIVDVTDSAQKVIHQGLYPEKKIIDAMNRALRYLEDESTELLYRVCVFHYLLGYIHPFYDGNGRLNRFISSYMLGKELHPLLGYRLSYTIKENITQYYKAYKICNRSKNRGDLTPFVSMFLEVIMESITQLHGALKGRLAALYHYGSIIERLPYGNKEEYSCLYYILIQAELFSEHGISMKGLTAARHLSETTLRNQLQKIEATGLLKSTLFGHAKHYKINLNKMDQY